MVRNVPLKFFCHMITPFTPIGELDETGLRQHLRRLVAAGNGVFLCSPGAGESHAMSLDEMRRVYEVGVEEAKGRVPVYAAVREARTASDAVTVAKIAIDAGVDVVQLHQLDAGHGMFPNAREQEVYFHDVLSNFDYPLSISVHSGVGYSAPVPLIAELFDLYPSLQACSVVGPGHAYFLQLRDALADSVEIIGGGDHFLHDLALGASGFQGSYGNIIPNTCRRIVEAYEASDVDGLSTAYRTFRRVVTLLSKWHGSGARSAKLALKVLGLGNGALRLPYLLPPEQEQAELAAAFEKWHIRELEGIGGSELINA